MFRPKKHLKLDLLKSAPSIDDLKQAVGHARKLRGCTIELPWDLEKYQASFALAVRIEVGVEEAFWTLYSGEGNKSHVLWSAPFSDLSLLHEVISLSLSEIIGPQERTPSPKETSNYSKDKEAGDVYPARNETSLDSFPTEQTFRTVPHDEPVYHEESPQPTYNQPAANSMDSQVNLPAQNFYPNINPGSTGGFPAMPPPNSQIPMPYVYYYPGYPYPIPMPFPPGMTMPANSLPLQQGLPVLDPNASATRLPPPDAELLRKQTNYMIGQFLVDSNLITDSTLKMTLKLQEMIVGNVISATQAYEAIEKIHSNGGYLDIAQLIKESPTSGNISNAPKQSYTLLGDLLVKSKVLNKSLLDAVLKMQEIVRAGAISKDEACQAIIKELAKTAPSKNTILKTESDKEKRVLNLLIRCSLLTIQDHETALAVQKKHGGQLGQILISAGKLHSKTYQAALESDLLLQQSEIKLEQAIIALNYCARTRMTLDEAIKDLGFHKSI